VVKGVGDARHDRRSSRRYRVLASSTSRASGNDVTGGHGTGSGTQGWRICLGRASPSRSGRGEDCQKSAGGEDKEPKQDAQIQESGLSSVLLFQRRNFVEFPWSLDFTWTRYAMSPLFCAFLCWLLLSLVRAFTRIGIKSPDSKISCGLRGVVSLAVSCSGTGHSRRVGKRRQAAALQSRRRDRKHSCELVFIRG